nr:ornithine cyclodeaminase family protein [Bacteroidota bacterium]
MRVLNKSQILRAAVLKDLADAIVKAYQMYENGEAVVPTRMHADFDGNTLLLMPAYNKRYFATKLVSVYPDNPSKGHAAIYGSVILNNGETGEPLALLDGSTLTALRTGAVGGVGIRYTTPFETHSAGLVGAGFQGFYQLIFACMERPIKKVKVFDQNPENTQKLISKITSRLPCVKFSEATSVEELVSESEIIITATNSTRPVLPNNPELYPDKHFIAMGSFKPDMRELPDAVFTASDQLFIDTKDASHESGDVIDPLTKNLIFKESVIPFSKLVTGKVQLSYTSTTVFKSVGMALFDLVAAIMIYEKAVEKGLGVEVEMG